jgi:hypothetical protein
MVDASIQLTDDIKEHVLLNRIYKNPLLKKVNATIYTATLKDASSLKEQVRSLQLEIAMLRGRYDEKFYQTVVERYLGKSHMKLKHCVTDVTTATTHVEIKRWAKYTDCIGQLMTYQAQCPKDESHAYMFDETCGKSKIATAVTIMKKVIPGIKMFTFDTSKTCVKILNCDTNEVVFEFIIS